MKTTIVTTRGTVLTGTLNSTKTYIVALDVPKQLIDRQLIETLYDEQISATEYSKDWQIIIERNKIESIEFED